MTHDFRIWQGGMSVAAASSVFRNDAASQISHYAALYVSEGDLEVQEKLNGRWKTIAELKDGK